jgi:hypothetical protein
MWRILWDMAAAEPQELFSDFHNPDGLQVINDRCLIRTQGGHRVVIVSGIVLAQYAVTDRMAETHAMISLVDQGWADQNDVARVFGYTARTVRRQQQRFDEGGLAALGRKGGYPGTRRPHDVLNQDIWNRWPGWYDDVCYHGAPNKCRYGGEVRGEMIRGAFPAVLSNAEWQDMFRSDSTVTGKIPNTSLWLQLAAYPAEIVSAINSASSYLWTDGAWVLHRTTSGADMDNYFEVDLSAGAVMLKELGGGTLNPFSNAITWGEERLADLMQLVVTYSTNPVGGGHFDRRHVTAKMREGENGWTNDKYYYGAWSGGSSAMDPTDNPIPRNATQWTETGYSEFGLIANKLFPGAWIYMEAGSGLLVMQKWAEIKLPWKSQNWFGPCGAQRDIRVGGCSGDTEEECTSATGGTVRWPKAFPIEGDRTLAGFPTESEGTVTFRTTLAAGYLRVGDQVQFTDEALSTVTAAVAVTAVVSATEFQYAGALPAAGVTRVRSVVAGIATPPYWIYDTDGKGEFIGAWWEFDYRTYELAEEPKPEMVKTYDLYDSALRFDQCTPGVICYTPTDTDDPENEVDVFERAVYLPWSEPTYIDEGFGTRSQSMVYQVMDDIYWEPPRSVCVWNDLSEPAGCEASKCAWKEDLAETDTCTETAVVCDEEDAGGWRVHAHRPMVEACFLCIDYDNSGQVPIYDRPPVDRDFYERGVSWNIKDRLIGDHGIDVDKLRLASDYHSGDGPTFEPPDPPAPLGGDLCTDATCAPVAYDVRFTPWILFKAMQLCICGEKLFAEDYKNTLGCWMCGAEPAVVVDPELAAPAAPELPAAPAGATVDGATTDLT